MSPDEHRISRRSLLRGQLMRWADEPAPALPQGLGEVADTIVELAGIRSGMSVLHLGSASDAVGRAAARRGADVTAHASAGDLPFADGAFDAVVSGHAAALARDRRLAARELVRVTCPGATVALAAWSPAAWADEAAARADLEGLLDPFDVRPHPGDPRCLLLRGRRPIPQA